MGNFGVSPINKASIYLTDQDSPSPGSQSSSALEKSDFLKEEGRSHLYGFCDIKDEA
jgi:hypothetical protein